MAEIKAKRFLSKDEMPPKYSGNGGAYGEYYNFLKHFERVPYDCVEVVVPRGKTPAQMATAIWHASKNHFDGKFGAAKRGNRLFVIKK